MKLLLVLAAIALSWHQCHNTCLTTGDPSNENGSPDVSASTISDAIFSYTVKQYKEMISNNETRNKNIVTSPFSIWAALGMTYLGARGEASDELGTVLGVDGLQKAHVGHRALELGQSLLSAGSEVFSFANRITFAKSLNLKKCVIENPGLPVSEADFANKPEESRTEINSWVSNVTNEKIPELLPEGAIKSNTVIVLLNAVNFKGSWVTEFKNVSIPAVNQFKNYKGEFVPTQMMELKTDLPYSISTSHGGYKAAELDYKEGGFSMVLILPDNDLNSFVEGLNSEKLKNIVTELSNGTARVLMPKFKINYKMTMSELLPKLGARKMFESIDLSGIVSPSPPNLSIDEVYHEAFIDVNEKGTEAAAATAVVGGVRSGKYAPTINFNRPFMFLIRHEPTNTVLFSGQVKNL